MNKTILTAIIVAALCGAGGYMLGSRSSANRMPESGQFAQQGGSFQNRGANRTSFGGAEFGTIVSTDANSITIELMAGTSTGSTSGTKLVLIGTNTQIQKMVEGSVSDLKQGESVTVMGSANSDGSVSATSIQIRPTRQAQ